MIGNNTLPVEEFVLPHLGSDRMLIDNDIMQVVGAWLDWKAETSTFPNDDVTLPAIHTKNRKRFTGPVELWSQAKK